MNRTEFLKYFRETTESMVATVERKNADYAGADADDAFFNFTRAEANKIASTETGFLIRMSDKFARITTFVAKGVLMVKDESVEDTLLDLANYCILLAAYIKSKKARARASDVAIMNHQANPSV